MTAQPIQPAARERLHVPVQTSLEERILRGDLQIGDKLDSESKIARDFGISTRSVREAIQALETKGLVQRRHGGNTMVVRRDVNEFIGSLAVTVRQQLATEPGYLRQLTDARRMIEVEVIDLHVQAESPALDGVEAELARMRSARDANAFDEFVEADAAFHLALVRASGNRILAIMYENFANLINDMIRVSSRVPTKSLAEAYDEHEEIFTRIRDRDGPGAKALMRAQIARSTEYLHIAIKKEMESDQNV
ncbi:FCD domain-containing protein [Marinovum sp. 2_MG-2023]|uniref:FadR/GntR family transcriptional regulator n=1 Tax=unclassified Marinovum TaxID=2647166 RepID=UPI0026E28779|nr:MULTISPECIES: FCD domain-containing protein [unclassified Marinovum]MDO6731292.1 FCD domain-containing protein [Marinovum sp. 2_MG-2023]MDO6780556.1 FCD domain-containing protein [Marinovum sp. 1_MG-2023]